MSSQPAAWGLAPEHGETPPFTNVVEFALALYGQIAHIQRDVGTLSASQQDALKRIENADAKIDGVEGRLGQQIRETESRLSDRIRESESRMANAVEASEARGESMIAKVLQEIDARAEARFSRMEARFDAVDARFDAMDARFDRADTRMDKMDARFDKLDTRFDKADERVDKLEENLNARIEATGSKVSALKDRVNKVLWVASGGGVVLGLAVGWRPIFERLGTLASL